MSIANNRYLQFQLCGTLHLLPIAGIHEVRQNFYMRESLNLSDQPWVLAVLDIQGRETILLNSYKVLALAEPCFKTSFNSLLCFEQNGQNYALPVEDVVATVQQTQLEILDSKSVKPALYNLLQKKVLFNDNHMLLFELNTQSLHIFISNQNDLRLAG